MRQQLQQAAIRAADRVTAGIPQAVPDRLALQNCKIISHRGEHDNGTVIENTLQAFDNARAAGVWGMECDIRWTRDLVPVIHHDASGTRLFGDPAMLYRLTFTELRRRLPLIPSLAELVAEFGGNTHLMLEIKADHYPQPARQKRVLQELLSPLTPGQDYHFLTLDPALAEYVDFLPGRYCVLVAELNMPRLSRYSLERGLGGLAGHFLLLSDAVKQRHMAAGQHTGTGYISSRNCLFRELNRGIEWIFSNDAIKIQQIRDRQLALRPRP